MAQLFCYYDQLDKALRKERQVLPPYAPRPDGHDPRGDHRMHDGQPAALRAAAPRVQSAQRAASDALQWISASPPSVVYQLTRR